jgi:hypothetical protein
MAERFCVSSRTLKRRLAEKDTTNLDSCRLLGARNQMHSKTHLTEISSCGRLLLWPNLLQQLSGLPMVWDVTPLAWQSILRTVAGKNAP